MATGTEKISLKRPLVLSGGPRRVCGSLEVANDSGEEVFLTSVPIHESTLKDPFGNAIREIPVMRTIPPGGSVSVLVRLLLDRTTPPGNHEISLALNGGASISVVQVSEQTALKVIPRQLLLQGGPKAILRQTITVQNLSNVGLVIDKLGGVILDEEDALCRSLQASLRAKGQEGFTPFVDALTAEFAATRVDLLRVGIKDDAVKIPPGESGDVTLKLHVPGDVKPGRTYSGILRIQGAIIDIQLNVTNEPGEAEPD